MAPEGAYLGDNPTLIGYLITRRLDFYVKGYDFTNRIGRIHIPNFWAVALIGQAGRAAWLAQVIASETSLQGHSQQTQR